MTKTIIMFSGGSDSTVLVDKMLLHTTDELVLCYLKFTNVSKDIKDDIRFQKHKKIADAQAVAIKQITDYWKQAGYRSFTLDFMPYSLPMMYPSGSHSTSFPMMGALAVRNHQADRFMTGITPATLANTGDLKKHKIKEAVFDLILQYPLTKAKVLTDLKLPGRKIVGKSIQTQIHGVTWEKPLCDWGWHKYHVARNLPPELRALVVSCDYGTTYEDHWEKCGECFRCNKWIKVCEGLDDTPAKELSKGEITLIALAKDFVAQKRAVPGLDPEHLKKVAGYKRKTLREIRVKKGIEQLLEHIL